MQTREENTWLKYIKQYNDQHDEGNMAFSNSEIDTITESAINDLHSVLGHDNSVLLDALLKTIKIRAKG